MIEGLEQSREKVKEVLVVLENDDHLEDDKKPGFTLSDRTSRNPKGNQGNSLPDKAGNTNEGPPSSTPDFSNKITASLNASLVAAVQSTLDTVLQQQHISRLQEQMNSYTLQEDEKKAFETVKLKRWYVI
jgi:hypothetical protein